MRHMPIALVETNGTGNDLEIFKLMIVARAEK
jgi:hypothetical protein